MCIILFKNCYFHRNEQSKTIGTDWEKNQSLTNARTRDSWFPLRKPHKGPEENAYPVIERTMVEGDVDVKTRLVWRESANRELNVSERTPY